MLIDRFIFLWFLVFLDVSAVVRLVVLPFYCFTACCSSVQYFGDDDNKDDDDDDDDPSMNVL